ncbi:MAG: RNA polymerase sigma factor [Chloroflexi bacterium]|nr:RNA polymerase sigma factor [Chloroflexota bacterium]
MLSDQDLIQQILEQDAHAFETLFDRYEEMMRRHIARIVRSDALHPPDAATQDLLQEVFLRVWTRAEQWDGSGTFKAWLYRIATNLAFNHLRSVRRRKEHPLNVPNEWNDEEENTIPAWLIDASAPDPDAALELGEQRERLWRIIERLPEEKREVFHLVHEMEMSMRDAADELGIPEGTVKSRLYYAKRRLAREWKNLETT